MDGLGMRVENTFSNNFKAEDDETPTIKRSLSNRESLILIQNKIQSLQTEVDKKNQKNKKETVMTLREKWLYLPDNIHNLILIK